MVRVYLSDDIPYYDKKEFEKNVRKGILPKDDNDNRRDDLGRPTFMESEQAKNIWQGILPSKNVKTKKKTRSLKA